MSVLATLLLFLLTGSGDVHAPRFFKGNTHTHTLWSDGNTAPEMAAGWYRSHGYQFLVLSDHNILSRGEKWFPVRSGPRSRLTPERMAGLRRDFPDVETRTRDGQLEMRLKTLTELRDQFEKPGEFLFMEGEEVTDRYDPRKKGARRLEIHINAVNTSEFIEPRGGTSAADVMNRDVSAIIAQGARSHRPVLAHINHPNFGWSLTWRDVAAVSADHFFEVFNGHRSVHNRGDETHESMDDLWDKALTLRLTDLHLGLLYGLATDDSHHYWGHNRTAVPGRGWVMVRARELTAAALIAALKRGDFYASTGVTVADFESDGVRYRVQLAPRSGESLTVRFIGARRTSAGIADVGVVLMETGENPAIYRFHGDELYVRAVVVSSLPHPNPSQQGDMQTAWLQPVIPGRAH